MVHVRYEPVAIEPRSEAPRPGGLGAYINVGGDVTIICLLTVDRCSVCRETIEYDPQVLTLLDSADTRDYGAGSLDLRSRWRLRGERPGTSQVRLWVRANGNPQLIQIQVTVREHDP